MLEEALDAFSHAHRAAMKRFRDDLSARIRAAEIERLKTEF